MSQLFFEKLLLPEGWASDVMVGIADGLVASVAAGAAPRGGESHKIGLPGIANLHSHTFQRTMAGLAEYRGAGEDNFWSWREQMYRFALKMSPEDVQAAAAQAFVEMLESGFTGVAEFHYLHHDPNGQPYANIAEMAERVAAAAVEVGISLVLLPVFYAHSNFGGQKPVAGQRRFINSLEAFELLYEKCQALGPAGVAPHSLRAVTPHELTALIALAKGRPFHMHISEQTREVADCEAWSGMRPVAWLLSHQPVAKNWCLIHATHVTAAERRGIARAGAVAGLCPITEANLGDGIFPTKAFSGAFGIGTDSNVLIDAAAELRQLEYAQRLLQRQRNVLTAGTPATGTNLWQSAVAGGAQALGVPGGIVVGAPADFVTLDVAKLGPVAAQGPETALNAAMFAARMPMVDGVWVGGRKLVEGGRHKRAGTVRTAFDAMLGRRL
jgi:formimidoylglutamate deiminase